MSLLREIQADAIDSGVSIADLLRKCMLLAARLGNEDFKTWVNQELNGYSAKEALPKYRIIDTISFGQFTDGFRCYPKLSIPFSYIPEEYHEIIGTHYFTDPISSLDHLIENSDEKSIVIYWPADLIALLGNKIYSGMYCLGAWNPISASTLAAILDTVRTRILEFAIEIERENPNAGEAYLNEQPISPEYVRSTFNTVILGNVGNLAQGSSDIKQDVHQGDLESLKKCLLGIGISKSDLRELDTSLAYDERVGIRNKIGTHTKEWIGKVSEKVPSGAEQVSTSVLTSLITKAISVYLGLE